MIKQQTEYKKPAILSSEQRKAGRRFLHQLLESANLAQENQSIKHIKRAIFWLHLRLNYEKWTLGSDAQSLYLLKQATVHHLPLPPLQIGQWLHLLALSPKKI